MATRKGVNISGNYAAPHIILHALFIYMLLMMNVTQPMHTFCNLTRSTLLPPKTSAPTLDPSPTAVVSSGSNAHALALSTNL